MGKHLKQKSASVPKKRYEKQKKEECGCEASSAEKNVLRYDRAGSYEV